MQRKKADDIVLPRSPNATKAVHSNDGALPRLHVVAEAVGLSPGPSCSTFSDNPVIGSPCTFSNIQDHVETVFFGAEETAKRVRNAVDLKVTLASKCAMERKFKLLDVAVENDSKEIDMEGSIMDTDVMNSLFGLAVCPESGAKSMTFSKKKRRPWAPFQACALE